MARLAGHLGIVAPRAETEQGVLIRKGNGAGGLQIPVRALSAAILVLRTSGSTTMRRVPGSAKRKTSTDANTAVVNPVRGCCGGPHEQVHAGVSRLHAVEASARGECSGA